MPTFVLIDHSLKRPGGHHYDYAFHVLEAADAAGFQIVLATHRRFRSYSDLPSHWQVKSLFPYPTYNPYTVFRGSRSRADSAHANPRRTLWTLLHNHWRDHQRKRRIDHFTHCLGRLFDTLQLKTGDQVFLPTLSELDLQGLVAFLRQSAISKELDWHLQFHFNIFTGREPDYETQAGVLIPLRHCFQQALHQVPQHRLYFYNTTESLTQQYQRLQVAKFEYLPYPINPALQPRVSTGSPNNTPRQRKTLRVACLGTIRHEKGQHELVGLVQDWMNNGLDRDRLQLLVQTNKRRLRRELSKYPNVIFVKHPLSCADYVELIRDVDIGLFLYDSERYYTRHAGILGEFLAAGVPVIVPAGCWLADQLTDVLYEHQTQCSTNITQLIDVEPHTCISRFHAPDAATNLLITWHTNAMPPGVYLRVRCRQRTVGGDMVKCYEQIVGPRTCDGRRAALFALQPEVATVDLAWENAYTSSDLDVRRVEVAFVNGTGRSRKPHPLGAVGLIAADRKQIPDLLADMVQHYAHYQHTALTFARTWAGMHDPRRTLGHLLQNTRA